MTACTSDPNARYASIPAPPNRTKSFSVDAQFAKKNTMKGFVHVKKAMTPDNAIGNLWGSCIASVIGMT